MNATAAEIDKGVKLDRFSRKVSKRQRIITEALEKSGDKTLVVQAERAKKVEKFIEEFVANGGNATEAAMVAFKPSSRIIAANLGSEVLKEVKQIGSIYMDQRGASYGALLDTAIEKMKESKSPEWWDRLMKLGGHEDFISKEAKATPISVNIINGQKDFLSGYIEEGEVLPDED